MAAALEERPDLLQYLRSAHEDSSAPNPPILPSRAPDQAIFWVTNTDTSVADVYIANEENLEKLLGLIESEFIETLFRCFGTFYNQLQDVEALFELQKDPEKYDFEKCKRVFGAIEHMFRNIKVAVQVNSVEETFQALIRNEVYKEFNPRMMSLVTDTELVSEYMAYLLLLPSVIVDVIDKGLKDFFHQMHAKLNYIKTNLYKEELFKKRVDRVLEAAHILTEGFKQQIEVFDGLRSKDTPPVPADLKFHIQELIRMWHDSLSKKAKENSFPLGSITFKQTHMDIVSLKEPALYRSVLALFLEDLFQYGLPSFKVDKMQDIQVSLKATKVGQFTGKAHLTFLCEIEPRESDKEINENDILKEVEAYFHKPFRGMLLERSSVDVVTTAKPSQEGRHTLKVRFDFGAVTVTEPEKP